MYVYICLYTFKSSNASNPFDKGIYVDICLYLCIYIYTYMYVFVHVYTYQHIQTCVLSTNTIHKQVPIQVFDKGIYIDICVYLCMYVCVCKYMYICMCIYM
jgi:hypothetical protein